MDNDRFEAISRDGLAKLTALMSPMAGALGGRRITYNAYFRDHEVVVLGYQYDEDGHSFTKPVAIIVDPEVFNGLRVDDEGFRVGPDGEDQAPLLHNPTNEAKGTHHHG